MNDDGRMTNNKGRMTNDEFQREWFTPSLIHWITQSITPPEILNIVRNFPTARTLKGTLHHESEN